MPRLALFGGSFNPPHVGHQMAMLYALATARVDGLLMIPCFRRPAGFDKPLAPFTDRLEMCRRAALPFGGRVEVSDIEGRIGKESRTLVTVRALAEERPGSEWVLVLGSDLNAERTRWFGWAELERLVEVAVVGRAGHDAEGVAIPDVSSSAVRERLAKGERVDGWLPAPVQDYVAERGLYRAAATPG